MVEREKREKKGEISLRYVGFVPLPDTFTSTYWSFDDFVHALGQISYTIRKYLFWILMSSSDDHRLKEFFILVNSSQKDRMKFLLDPIPYIEKMLPEGALTKTMIEDIEEIKEKLIEVDGIVAIPPGIRGLIKHLKEGTDLPEVMEDDSFVC